MPRVRNQLERMMRNQPTTPPPPRPPGDFYMMPILPEDPPSPQDLRRKPSMQDMMSIIQARRMPQNRSVMDVASQMFRPDAPYSGSVDPAGRGTVGPGYPTGKALPRPINRMPPRMPPGRFFPGGPGRPPGGPFGQGPTRRMPPPLDPSRGRAGMDRILNRLRGTRNPMDRMSPSRSRPPTPIDFTPSNLPGGSYQMPNQPPVREEIRSYQNTPKPPRYEELPYSMPRNIARMEDGGEVNPLDAMYAQIGVEDENTAREVIEKNS